ncbi:hypothetical protein [Rhodovulum sulfidophilum]|uniref:hypothetical protein n=1 Tax=Rhodovulum sulfidophilum TaxID=35806 RepID=UPI001F25859C|nr:hypothetical protein [Rhodovulum sulfidophilum]MCE8438573.1 hypothetical protein [Rhodovulum sulfidophilum]
MLIIDRDSRNGSCGLRWGRGSVGEVVKEAFARSGLPMIFNIYHDSAGVPVRLVEAPETDEVEVATEAVRTPSGQSLVSGRAPAAFDPGKRRLKDRSQGSGR